MKLKVWVGVLLVFFLWAKEIKAVCCAYSSTAGDSVIMGQGLGGVSVVMGNYTSPGYCVPDEGIDIVEFDLPDSLYFPHASISFVYMGCDWNVEVQHVGNLYRVRFVNPYGPVCSIPADSYFVFTLMVSGPNGGSILSASGDVVDSFTAVRAYGETGIQCTDLNLGSYPSFTRRSFDIGGMQWLMPLASGVGDQVVLEMRVANRSTATQTDIVPSVVPYGPVSLVEGPVPPSLSLPPGEVGTFTYVYASTATGQIYFMYDSVNNAVGSSAPYEVTASNPAMVDELTSFSFLEKYHFRPGDTAKLYTMVYRNYPESVTPLSAGDVIVEPFFSITEGDMDAVLVSAPYPPTYPAIATGGAAVFSSSFTVSGTVGRGYFGGMGIAIFPEVIITDMMLASSASLVGCDYDTPYIAAEPNHVLGGSFANPITFMLFSSSSPIQSLTVFHNPEFSYIPGSARGGYGGFPWSVTEFADGVTFTAPAGGELPPCDTAQFTLEYDIPDVPIETLYVFRANVDPAFVFVVPFALRLSLGSSPPFYADGETRINITASFSSPLANKYVMFTTTCGMLLDPFCVTDANGQCSVTMVAPFSPNPITCKVEAWYGYTPNFPSLTLKNRLYNFKLYHDYVDVNFLGYPGDNILYVGGTLLPLETYTGHETLFSFYVRNVGDTEKVISTLSTFTFTDGINTFTAHPSSSVTVPVNERRRIIFSPEIVSPSFSPGKYMPTFTYNPDRTVWDEVTVSGTTGIEVAYFTAEQVDGGVELRWAVYGGNPSYFNILREDKKGSRKANPSPIPFLYYGEYSFLDSEELESDTFYFLEVKGKDGTLTTYGPSLISVSIDIGDANGNLSLSCSFPGTGMTGGWLIFMLVLLTLIRSIERGTKQ